MTGHKGIGFTLVGLGETGNSAVLAKTAKGLPASRKDLMNIGLMSHIKHKPVFFRVKYGLNGNRQFHRTQVAGQMAAGFGDTVNQKVPDLLTKLYFFSVTEADEVLVTVDLR